jgi:1-phosphatidylinositol-4-phosphate 5-kinase
MQHHKRWKPKKGKKGEKGFKVNVLGEVIFKGHPCWVLMHSIQMGIRHFARRLTRSQGLLLQTPNFTKNTKFYSTPRTLNFPSNGTQDTPAHTLGDFQFKDYCPLAFRFLRTLFGIELRDYINSLCNTTENGSNPLRLMATPGKSGSLFFFTSDMKYIIKTIPRDEAKLLLRILPPYANYVLNNPNTLLPRFYGLHRVKPHKGQIVRLVVMANLFATGKTIDRRYDLKGSLILRYVPPAEKERKGPSCTLKDENWLEDKMKLQVGPDRKDAFLEQLRKDSALLASLDIMDYSLLVGTHFTDINSSKSTQQPKFLTVGNELLIKDRTEAKPTHEATVSRISRLRMIKEDTSESEQQANVQRPMNLAQLSPQSTQTSVVEQNENKVNDEKETLQNEQEMVKRKKKSKKLNTVQVPQVADPFSFNLELAEKNETEAVDFLTEKPLGETETFTDGFGVRPLSAFDDTGEGSFFGRNDKGELTKAEYFVGIIDILMLYSARKKMEHVYKSMRYNTQVCFSFVFV